MKKETLKKIGNIAGKIITILSLIFIVVAIYKLGFDFSSVENVPVFILILIGAGIIICIAMYLMGIAWKLWLDFFSGKKNSFREVVCVYTKANIGKYLPGNVMHYVERNLFAGKLGISQKKIAACSVIEIIGQAGVAVLFGLLFSFQQLKEVLQQLFDEKYKTVIFIAIPVILVIMAAMILIFRKKIAPFVKEYANLKFLVTAVKCLVLYAVVLIVSGLVMVMLYQYMGGTLTSQKVLLIISGYIIAWVLGFVVPGAPGGIGVREFVLTVLLSPALGQELTLTLSVIHRLITIVGDFMAYVFRLFLQKKDRKQEEKE